MNQISDTSLTLSASLVRGLSILYQGHLGPHAIYRFGMSSGLSKHLGVIQQTLGLELEF